MKNLKKIYKILIYISFTFILTGVSLVMLIAVRDKNYFRLEKSSKIKEEYKKISFEAKNNSNEVAVQEKVIVYDNLSYDELVEKINKNLNSTIKDAGKYYLDASLEYGVDPYLAVAISLHETGCKWNCSSLVTECYNLGGIKGSPSCGGGSYRKFDTLEEGINYFVKNIADNYYSYGYTTAETMQRKYTGYETSSWSMKVNRYIDTIKNS